MQERVKNTALKTVQYRRLEKGFSAWLETLGYAPSTVYGAPQRLREFLQWLEKQDCTQIENVTEQHIALFMGYFKNRANQRRSGGLSNAYINKQIDMLQKLFRYLKATDQHSLKIKLKKLKVEGVTIREILTKEEIQQLYDATDDRLIGMRDRAMLGVYYGCGIRKSEGIYLEVADVLFERKLLYIRKAKNLHERYVPINLKVLQDLETYIYQARPLLIKHKHEKAFFISETGGAMQGQSMVTRLKILQQKTENPQLQNRSFGLHALRHSIATHLLQAGMDLENIALFLGHKTLDSTQLYTHIVNQL